MKFDLGKATTIGFSKKRAHQGCADTTFSPIGQYRDATDSAVRHQACGTNCPIGSVESEDVLAGFVQSISLERFGHCLFLDKHRAPHRENGIGIRQNQKIGEPDRES